MRNLEALEALAALGRHLTLLRLEGHHGWPFPAFLTLEGLLQKALRGEPLTQEDLDRARKALEAYPLEAMADGAHAWAASPPQEVARFFGEEA